MTAMAVRAGATATSIDESDNVFYFLFLCYLSFSGFHCDFRGSQRQKLTQVGSLFFQVVFICRFTNINLKHGISVTFSLLDATGHDHIFEEFLGGYVSPKVWKYAQTC